MQRFRQMRTLQKFAVTVWMYARFTLSLSDVEELLAERGLDISTNILIVRRILPLDALNIGELQSGSVRKVNSTRCVVRKAKTVSTFLFYGPSRKLDHPV